MVCCNDERGNPLRHVERFDFEDADSHRMSLEGPAVSFKVVACGPGGTTYRISRRMFFAKRVQHHVGNLCWDALSMSEREALLLLEYLGARRYQATDWTLEGPFAARYFK